MTKRMDLIFRVMRNGGKKRNYILAKGASGASNDGEVRLSHEANYAYFDTDICFIEDCRTTLDQRTGFVVADTELIKYGEASTQESMEVLSRETSLWSLKLFNTGHFASDTPLYSLADLESTCEKYKETCLLLPTMSNQELTS